MDEMKQTDTEMARRYDILMGMYIAQVKEGRRLRKAIRRKNKLIQRLRK